MVLNRIFEVGFTLIREIYPTYKDLSNNLAMLRNRDQVKYDKLRAAFKSISGNIEVLVEEDGNNAEHILFKEGDRKYGINNSASGYYALTSILYKLLEGQSGLVAIDEPETTSIQECPRGCTACWKTWHARIASRSLL